MASTPTTVTPPSTPIMRTSILTEKINDSWCELQLKSGCSSASSTNRLYHSVNPEMLEKLLQEAQKETNYPSTSISVQSSPKSPQTPITSITYQNECDLQYSTNIDLMMNVHNRLTTQSYIVENLNNSTDNLINSNINRINNLSDELTLNITPDNQIIRRDTDWTRYLSRPQINPPKEWNFIHPNSANSRYSMRNNELMNNKLLSKETINKLIVTHMASFILGATLRRWSFYGIKI